MAPDDQLAAVEAGHRRLSEQVKAVQGDIASLNRAVAALVRAQSPDEKQPITPSLISQPDAAVIDLLDWLAAVYLRYHDGALAPCWAWHPGLVEELTWLRGAHQAVYASRNFLAIGDWHDRYRPGVARRVSAELRACDIGRHTPAIPDPVVPLADALAPIAAARANGAPVPEPTPEQRAHAQQFTTRTRPQARTNARGTS